ncbi:MAG: YccF domain-containing protein [Bacteroidetes bacterium]|nr:MAG: YccF domain-containing protein [Bacteroidota bacterium]
MNAIGNLLWIILGGFIIFVFYVFGSIILMITIIGIPFGIQTLKMANLALFPFGREAVQTQRSGGCLQIIMNIIWLLFAGIEIAILHLVLALIFAITIIGIPFAAQHLKLAYLALVPFGMDIVDKE